MKPCQKNRNDKSARVNIFSELMLTAKFFHYLRMNAIWYYWSYGTSGKMHPKILSPSLTLTITLTLTQGENLLGAIFRSCHHILICIHWLLIHVILLALIINYTACIDYFIMYWYFQFSTLHVFHFYKYFSITQLIRKRITVFPIINTSGAY